jgi:NADH-quinone oxidoreductase subunit K
VNVGPAHFAVLSAIVFALGLYGVLARRNALHVIVALVVLALAPVIALVGFAHTGRGGTGPPLGDALAFLALVTAGATAVVGLSVVMLLWRRTGSADVDELIDVEGG